MKKLFDNPKPAIYAVLVFLILFFTIRTCEAGTVELGPSLLNGYGLVYTESITSKWDVGVMLVSDQSWGHNGNAFTAGNNGGAFVQRIVRHKKFSMGLGIAGWMNTSAVIGCQVGFHLSIRYDLSPRFNLNWRHWSNAGTCDRNRGQDLATIGWRF